eukprot:6650791-Ditylum_brightwellii.AAC.1
MKSATALTTLTAAIGCSFAVGQAFDHTRVLDVASDCSNREVYFYCTRGQHKVAPVMKKEAESANGNIYVHRRVNVHANSKRHRYEHTIKNTHFPQVIDVIE